MRAHLIPPEFFTPYHAVLCAYAVLAVISNRYPPVWGRLPTRYSPVRHSVSWNLSENFNQNTSFDLHVLGTPPAFILSQDQTLMLKCLYPGPNLAWLIFKPFYCFVRFCSECSHSWSKPKDHFYKNFQGFTYCSVFKELCFVVAFVLISNSFILSYRFRFVKNFLKLFSSD